MSLLLVGGTIIDAVSERPREGMSILVEGTRIAGIGPREEFPDEPGRRVIDLRGKYLIPGLMNANVHLLCDVRVETLSRYFGRFEHLILEASQVALKNGLTTVFDTWGPRRALISVRDQINAGQCPGSRILCAGNIVGFDGPYSADFHAKVAEVATPAFVTRINAIWVENVGRHLMWLSPDEVAAEVRKYLRKGIDFVKFGTNEHFGGTAGAFLAFSPAVQAAIVNEAHRAGKTAQSHTMSVEGLKLAVEAGSDIIQHANHTGPTVIPESTLELIAQRNVALVLFPMTEDRLHRLLSEPSYRSPSMWKAMDTNVRNLMRCGAPILMANDGAIMARDTLADPKLVKNLGERWEDSLYDLGRGHFIWFEAMEQKGFPGIEILRAATRNIAKAYGVDRDLGTLESGKIADIVVLDRNPFNAAQNYRDIHLIIKDGAVVDREVLPAQQLLTAPGVSPGEEAACYVPFIGSNKQLPMCPGCMGQ